MNNNKKDAKTAYRPYDYAIGKILTQILADGQVTYALTFGHTVRVTDPPYWLVLRAQNISKAEMFVCVEVSVTSPSGASETNMTSFI